MVNLEVLVATSRAKLLKTGLPVPRYQGTLVTNCVFMIIYAQFYSAQYTYAIAMELASPLQPRICRITASRLQPCHDHDLAIPGSPAVPGLHFQLLLQALDVGTQLGQAPLSERPEATLAKSSNGGI